MKASEAQIKLIDAVKAVVMENGLDVTVTSLDPHDGSIFVAVTNGEKVGHLAINGPFEDGNDFRREAMSLCELFNETPAQQ